MDCLKRLLSQVKGSVLVLNVDARILRNFNSDEDSDDEGPYELNYFHEQKTKIVLGLEPACKFLKNVSFNFTMGRYSPRPGFCKDIVKVFSTSLHLLQLSVSSGVDDDENRGYVQNACDDWDEKSETIYFVRIFGLQYLPRLK